MFYFSKRFENPATKTISFFTGSDLSFKSVLQWCGLPLQSHSQRSQEGRDNSMVNIGDTDGVLISKLVEERKLTGVCLCVCVCVRAWGVVGRGTLRHSANL